MMGLFKRFRGNREENEEKSLKDNIVLALEKCKKEKKDELNKIDDIKQWGKDLILEIFEVPTAYWYDELKEYENIKFHETNINISERVIQKTDKVIQEYREQLKLSNAKVEFCDALIKKYENLINRLDKANNDIERLKNEERQMLLLNTHKKRLAEMRSETADFENLVEDTSKLEILKEDIQKIEEDFNIKKEVTEYIQNLDKDFTEDIDNTDSSFLRDEIQKITKQIKK